MTFTLVFNIIAILALVADYFFNLDTFGIIALGALPMTTSLSTPKNGRSMTFKPLSHLAPTNSTPADFDKFPYAHDFIDDSGVPQIFKRTEKGHPVPVVGSEVVCSYGIGYVERIAVGGYCIVRVVEFDETMEIPQYGYINEKGEHVASIEPVAFIDARTMVSKLSTTYNNRLEMEAHWYVSKFGDTKKSLEVVDAILDKALDADCYECQFVGGDYGGATEFYHETAKNPFLRQKKTKAEIRAERAALKRLANQMLDDADDADVPEGIADELAEVFGEE